MNILIGHDGPFLLNGLHVLVTDNATAELPPERWDWSRCRSPSRAKRRRSMKWVITRDPACYQVGHRLLVHPTLWLQIQDKLENA